MNESLAIETRGLTKVYGSGNTEVVAMREATMAVRRGEVIALLGPSGAGKSTFLTAVGLITPPRPGKSSSAACSPWTAPFPRSTCGLFGGSTSASFSRNRT